MLMFFNVLGAHNFKLFPNFSQLIYVSCVVVWPIGYFLFNCVTFSRIGGGLFFFVVLGRMFSKPKDITCLFFLGRSSNPTTDG